MQSQRNRHEAEVSHVAKRGQLYPGGDSVCRGGDREGGRHVAHEHITRPERIVRVQADQQSQVIETGCREGGRGDGGYG